MTTPEELITNYMDRWVGQAMRRIEDEIEGIYDRDVTKGVLFRFHQFFPPVEAGKPVQKLAERLRKCDLVVKVNEKKQLMRVYVG